MKMKWNVTLKFIFLLLTVLVDETLSCTLPSYMVGEWYDGRFLNVEFLDASTMYLPDYDISRQGSTTNLACYLSVGNVYVLRTTNIIQDTVNNVKGPYYYYLCMEVTQITDYSFYYYLQTDINTNAERTKAYNSTLSFDSLSPFCNTTLDLQLFSVMVRKGYESNALQTCSTPLIGDFDFQLFNTVGDECNSTGLWSFRDEDFTTLSITYTSGASCPTKIGHSDLSNVGCLLCINSGTTYYTAVFNLDQIISGYSTRFACIISEANGNNITLTQRGRLCHEDQTPFNPPSTEPMYPPIFASVVGALIRLSPTGESQSSKTADCFPKAETSSGSSSSSAVVIAVVVSLVLLVLLVILLLVIYFICKKKSKEKKENPGMGSPKKRSFVKQRGSNILVASHDTKEKIKIDSDDEGIEGVVTADYHPDVIVGGKSTKITQNDEKPGFQMTLPNETIMLSENEEKTEQPAVDNVQDTTIFNNTDEKQKSQEPTQSKGDTRQNQIASKYPANLTPTVWCLTQDSHEEPDKNTDVDKNDVNNDNLIEKPGMLLDKQLEKIQDKSEKSDDVNVSVTVGESKQVIANSETSKTPQASNQLNKNPEDDDNLNLQQKQNKIVIKIPNEKIENSEDDAEDPSSNRNQQPDNSILLSDEKARYVSVHKSKKSEAKVDSETKEESMNEKTGKIQNDKNIKETEHENNDQNFINNQDVDKTKVVHDEKQINNAMNNYHIRHDTGYETLNSSNEIHDARPESNTPNSSPEADNGTDSPACDNKDIMSGAPLEEVVSKGVNSEIDSLKEHEALNTIEASTKLNDPDLLTDDFHGTNGKGSDLHTSVTPHELRDKQSILSLLLDNECEEHSDSLYNVQNGPQSTDLDSVRQGQHSVKSDSVYRGPPSAELDSLHRGSPFADIDSLHNLQPSVDLDSLHHEQPSADLDSLNNRQPSVDLGSLHNGQSSIYSDNAHHTQHFPQIDNANLKHYTDPDDANLTHSADFDNDDLKRSFDLPYRDDFNMVDLKRSFESMSLISSSRIDDQSSVAVSNKALKDSSKLKHTNTNVNHDGKKRTGVSVPIHEKRSNSSSTSVPLHDKKSKTISSSVPFNERKSNVSSTPLPVIEKRGNTSSINSNETASRNHNDLRYEKVKTPDEPSDGDETLEKLLYIRNKSTFKKVTPRKFLYLPDIFTIKPLVRSGTMNKSVDARSGTMNKSLDDTDQNVKVQTTSSTHVHVKPTSPSGSSQYEEVEDVNYSPYRAAGWKMGRRRRIGGILDRQPTELPESRVKEKIDVISEMYKPKQKKEEKVKKFPLQSPRIRKARKRLKSVSPMERRKR